jgi:hypothetical protein
MVRGRLNYHFIARTFAIVIYVIFQCHSIESVNDNILESHKNAFLNSLIKKNSINALLIGGSNAVFGLSAKILTENTAFAFYNLSLLNNGFNKSEYLKYIKSISSEINRDKVALIIFSPIEILRLLPFENNYILVNGDTRSLFEKQLSMASYAYRKIAKKEKALTRNYRVTAQFGDFDFNNFNCDFQESEQPIFNPASVEDSYNYIYRYKLSLKKFFPKARIIITVPSEYDPVPEERKRCLLELSKKFKQNKIEYFDQSAINSIDFICESSHHLNSKGREVRSLDLSKKINLIVSKK